MKGPRKETEGTGRGQRFLVSYLKSDMRIKATEVTHHEGADRK